MSDAVINYDVSGRHVDVKKEMKARGYHDYFTENGSTYYLPNTTLWKKDTELATAVADIQAAAKKFGVTLERAIALSLSPRYTIPGRPHSE